MKFIDWLTPLRLKSRRRVERDLGSVQIANRLELLEDRSLLTAITIDYSFDANNFFDSQVKKDLMQLAADSIASRLTDSLLAIEPGPSGLGFDNTWTASFTHPATGDEGTVIDLMVPSDTLILFVGGRNLAGSTIGFGGPGGYDSSGTNDFLEAIAARGQDGSLLSPATDFGPWGGSITFDSDTNWFFGESIEGIGAAQSDFLSVAQHEVGHVLGMGTSAAWGTYVVGSNFTGPASMNANDGNAVVLNSDLSHWSQGTQSDGREATMTPAILNGTRGLFTNLDFAGLDDIGWDIAALPTLDAIGNVTIDEDASEQTMNLTGISAGGGESQPLRVTATSSNTGLIPNPTVTYTSADATGSLSFTPVADASGMATITVTVEDGGLDGDLDTTGDNATFSRTFDVTVSSVNDDPTLDALGNVTIDEDASEQTVNLTGISAGGAESQPLRVTATSSDSGLIPNPTVTYTSANATGSIAFTPVADESGMATITVTVEDGGLDGDLNTAGDNLTFSRTFDVTVSSVNDDPTLDALGNVTVDEDASEQTVNLTGISAGGGESQPLRVTATSSNTGLIPNPTVTYTSAETTGSLAFTPVPDASGTVTITVTVEDGGLDGDLDTAADNGQTVRTFAVHRTGPAAFYPSDTAITSGSSGSHSVSAVDLDGDGVTDFLAIRSENILRGVSIDGDGVPSTLFQMGTPSALGQYGTGLAIADFNGDGLNDLTDGVYVWNGNESGGLDSPDRIITAATNTLDVVAGDFDDDGHLDFASLSIQEGHTVVMLTFALGDGEGNFALTEYDTGRNWSGRVASGDFNGDGIDDVAFSNSNVFVVFGSPDRSYEIQPAASFSSDPVKALSAGDFNQDGRADLVIGQRYGDISVLLSDTDGNFSDPVLVHHGLPENTAWQQYGEVADIVVADFNSDGLLDIADVTRDGDNAHGNPTTAIVSLGDGHGGFSVRNVLSDNVNQTPVSLAAGDIDGDGDVDLLIGNYDSGRIGVLLNGDGTRFSPVADMTLPEDTVSHELLISGITAGQTAPRPLRVTAVSSNPALLPDPTTSYTPGSTTATLNLAPVGDASGTATITVILEDGGADQDLATPFDNTVYQRDLLVTVTAVNDEPTLDAISNLAINAGASEQTVELTGISAGGGESQPLRVTATSSDTDVIPNPTVTYTSAETTGSLVFTPVADAIGTVTITVTVEDGGLDGDLDTAGDNATFSRTMTVTVYPSWPISDLSELNGLNGAVLHSGNNNDGAGNPLSVVGYGDFNGDGYDDMFLFAEFLYGHDVDAYVVFGSDASFPDRISLLQLDGVNGFGIGGLYEPHAVAVADINGDGFADFLVSEGDGGGGGAIHVLFGHDGPFPATIDEDDIPGVTGFRVAPGNYNDFVQDVRSVGDIDGDGFADWSVTTNTASAVVFGGNDSFPDSVTLTDLLSRRSIVIPKADVRPEQLTGLGDINHDGYDDLAINDAVDPDVLNGKHYILFGGSELPASITGAGVPPEYGLQVSDQVREAGDVNGDGIADLLIGNSVVFGPITGVDGEFTTPVLTGSNGFSVTGGSVSKAGDINGDGIDDLLISNPGIYTNNSSGSVSVLFGKSSAFSATVDAQSLALPDGFRLLGEVVDTGDRVIGDNLGHTVAYGSDINGDGIDDVLVGSDSGISAYDYPESARDGLAYLLLGGVPADNTTTQRGTSADETLTASRGAAVRDVVIGAVGDDTLISDGGPDVLLGGAGNDTLAIPDGDFAGGRRLAGGHGLDTLQLTGSGQVLDLPVISNLQVTGIEQLDIRGTGANELRLSPLEVINLSDDSNLVTVLRDADDSVSIGDGWDRLGTEEIDGQWFIHFSSGSAVLLVQTGGPDAVSFDAVASMSIDEDAPEQTVGLTGITAGSGSAQPLRVTAVSNDTSLIPDPVVTYTSSDATGSLRFTPVADASGIATITVTVEDGGLDADLSTVSDNATFSRTFEVTVNAVNDDPTLDTPADISLVSTGAETILSLSGISAGGSELQPLRITAASSDTDLLPDPSVTYTAPEETGSLRFTVAAGRTGTATITLTVEDGGLDGELSTKGDNATITRTFDVTVQAGVDFGDAPDADSGTGSGNYNTTLADDGPRHLIVSTHATLFLGARVDGETDAAPSVRADGDDITGAGTDEEGLIEPAVDLRVTQGTSPVVRTRVTNLTGQTATLYGWIDYNGDGVFDNATERASVSVPSGVTAETVTLTFPIVPPDAITGTTYARFRLSTDTAAANPTGAADDGEVEDYVATVLRRSDGTVDVAKRTKIASLTNGGPLLADWNLFGRSVTSLGDIDGDGVNDLAVGAWYDSTDGDRRGAVHVLFLNADGSVRDSTRIASEVNGGPVLSDIDHFGVSLASPGDLDRDGVNDLVVGAQDDDTGGTDRGAVYVLFLQSDGTVRDSVKIASGLNGGPELVDEDKFGASVAALGDVDGDGVADLVVGASLDDSGGTNQGAVYIMHMNADGTVRDSRRITSASHPNFEIPNWAWFGFSVASVGDLNGDGVTDIAVGALADDTGGTDRGAVHVVFLQEDGSVLDVTKIASSTNGGPALQDSDNFGASLASLGDLNGDGTTDIAVGSSLGNTGGTDRGAVHLLFLTDTGSVASYVELASDLNGVPSLTDDDRFGLSVAAAGDVDGDGVLDLAVGAVRDDTGGTNRGAVHLLFLNRANETPTLAAFDALTLNQNAPTQTVSLSGIGAGAGESQPLQVTALSDNTSLIPNPTVTYASPETTGMIEFRPATGQSGTATITVIVEDGGIDGNLSTTSDNAIFSRSFTVTVNAGLNVIAELLPNATGQRVEIYASDSASITGLNLRVQLGDGTGAQSEPVFEGIDFTGSVFETFPTTVSGGPVNGAEQFLQASIVFDSAGNSVSASGLLATLIVDTTGFDSGSFELKFSATEIGADTALILPGGSEQSANLVNGYVRVLPAAVTGRHVFYNNSYFDGNSAAINAADDAAIATDKEPLFSGEVVTFANYTSYSRGINGVMIDLAGLRDAAALSLSDFVFRTGNVDNVTSWVTGATPDALLVRERAGADGVDRIVLTWPDGSFAGQWLEVTVRATAATGLAVPDIFYFGNAPGESGNSASNTFVDGTDFARARDNQRNFLNRAPIDFAMDYNRDSFVDGTDLAIARDSNTNFLTALRLLDLRLSSDASEMTGQQILSGSGQLSGSAQVSEASSATAPAVAAAITSFPAAEDGQDDLAAGQPFASGAASTAPLLPQSASVTPGLDEPVTNDGAIVVQYDGGESSDVSLDSVDLLFESDALQVLVLEI